MKNADKLKEKAEMAIQAKGWLSNVIRVLYTVRQQMIVKTWMNLLIVSLWISPLFGVVSRTTKLFQNTDSDSSSPRVFPGVPFDSESSKGNTIKSPLSFYISRC